MLAPTGTATQTMWPSVAFPLPYPCLEWVSDEALSTSGGEGADHLGETLTWPNPSECTVELGGGYESPGNQRAIVPNLQMRTLRLRP